MHISIQEYQKRVTENSIEVLKQITNGTRDVTKFHGVDAIVGELDPDIMLHKAHDIWVAALIGALAYIKTYSGADGVLLEDGNLEEVEFKSCYTFVSPRTAFKTTGGSIYFTKDVNLWGKSVKISTTTLAESKFRASFDNDASEETKLSKNRKTFLIFKDTSSGQIIDCYVLDGERVVELLKTSRDIKLGSFMKYGKQVKLQTPSVGYNKWYEATLATLQTKSRTPTGDLL